ncbi:hypothetical protein GS897_05335 [Rhodococcus hoagii]|nr:hypothetical protein [Prescottella equi]
MAQLALGSSGDGGVDLGSLADLALGSLGLPAGSAEPTLDLGSLAELASGAWTYLPEVAISPPQRRPGSGQLG